MKVEEAENNRLTVGRAVPAPGHLVDDLRHQSQQLTENNDRLRRMVDAQAIELARVNLELTTAQDELKKLKEDYPLGTRRQLAEKCGRLQDESDAIRKILGDCERCRPLVLAVEVPIP